MQPANDFWNQQSYDNSSVQNKSRSETNFATVLEDNSHTDKIEASPSLSFPDLWLPGVAITYMGWNIDGKWLNASVYHSENHSPDNPVYLVKGYNVDGTPFESEINVNDVDPRNASFIEMQALYAHLKMSGQKPPGFLVLLNPSKSVFVADHANPDAFTKADFLAPVRQMVEWSGSNRLGNYNPYKKLIDVLMNYV